MSVVDINPTDRGILSQGDGGSYTLSQLIAGTIGGGVIQGAPDVYLDVLGAPKHSTLDRGYAIFDTSAYAGATLNAITLKIPGHSKSNQISASPGMEVVSFSPSTTPPTISVDWAHYGGTSLGTIAYADFTTDNSYVSVVLNPASYSLGGTIAFGFRFTYDLSNSDPGGASDGLTDQLLCSNTNVADLILELDYTLGPSAPTLSSPSDGATNVPCGSCSNLVWGAVSGASKYHLQVATDAGFTSLVFDDNTITTPYFCVPGLFNNTTYHWRVSSIGTSEGSFSTGRSFGTTGNGSPDGSGVFFGGAGDGGVNGRLSQRIRDKVAPKRYVNLDSNGNPA